MPRHANSGSFKKGQASPNKKYNTERERYLAHREQTLRHNRAKQIQDNYGISVEEYDARLKAQGRICSLCKGVMDEKFTRSSKTSPVLDHCHKTGDLRDFIHQGCNLAIGMFDDDPVKLRVAAEYLEKHLCHQTK